MNFGAGTVLGRLTLIGFVAVAGAACGRAVAGDAPAGLEKWKLEIDLVQIKVDALVVFTPGKDGQAAGATIDIPIQNVAKVALSDVTYGGQEIRFTFQAPGTTAKAVFAAERAADGQAATGSMEQFGQKFAFTMKRVSEEQAGDVGRKPQTPRKPFPYDEREVSYTNPGDGTKLAGTLTLPRGKGPYPAVLLLTGSGPQDRDESLLGHKPFAVLADHLTRAGIAVLRVDDRGVGGSSGTIPDSSAEDFAADALAGVEFLKKQPEISPARIGLLGHSEGGMVAPIAAARSKDVAFVVLLAGTGIPGEQVLTSQYEAMLKASGVPAAAIAEHIAAQRSTLEAVRKDESLETIREHTRKLILLQTGRSSVDDATVDAHVANYRNKWFRSFLATDPAAALRQVTVPVLALNGSLDIQVLPELNLRAIEAALREAGNKDVTIRTLPGLNHLLQKATTGMMQEYAQIEETMNPEALNAVSEWIVAKAK